MAFDRSQLHTFANVAGAAVDAVVVAAVPGKRIRVLAFLLAGGATPAATTTFNTKPAGAGTAISPPFGLTANATVVAPDGNWFQTAAGEGLSVTAGAGATGVGVAVTYAVITP